MGKDISTLPRPAILLQVLPVSLTVMSPETSRQRRSFLLQVRPDSRPLALLQTCREGAGVRRGLGSEHQGD